MVKTFILRPETGEDLAGAYAFYEERQPGLGEEFLRCAEACMLSIRRYPEAFPVIHETYRRALLRRFPYAVFYESAGETVEVYALFHCSQDPAKWRNRLP